MYGARLKIMLGYFAGVVAAVRACYDGAASGDLLLPKILSFSTIVHSTVGLFVSAQQFISVSPSAHPYQRYSPSPGIQPLRHFL